VDISGGNLIIRNSDISLNGSFYQSTYNGFSMPGLTAIYNYPSLIYTPNDSATTFISSNVTITAGNSSTSSNTYILGNSNSIILSNVYVPRYANVVISANIPMGYDLSMLVQNANLYYGNNTYSNIINSPSTSSIYSNLTLLTTSDVVKGNCTYSLNSMVIPISINLSGSTTYNTPSNLSSNSTGNSVVYSALNYTTTTGPNNQVLVANIVVPPYYMGNTISVYTPIAANIYYTIPANSGNITKSTSANVSVNVTGIYANVYQNGIQWGNVTLNSSSIYGNFIFSAGSTANISVGNILQANVYLTTGNVSFVPDYSNNTTYYTVKYYLTSTYTTTNSITAAITLNTPTITGNANISVLTSTAVGALSFSSNTYYTGGIASQYSTNGLALGGTSNVTYLAGSYTLASYYNKITNNLNNYPTTITTTIPYIYAVNSSNNIIQTFTNSTDYSSNFVSSFLYYASQTYTNQNYNANILLGNINIPSTTLLKDGSDNTSTIKIIANVNVAYSYNGYNINTLGTTGNISYITYYSNPSTTTNSISGNIGLYNYGTTTSISQATVYALSGNIQLNKSTLSINSNIANIVMYDGANNYLTTVPTTYYTLTGTNTSGNNYTINYGNVAVNSNVYLKNIMGMINISNYSLPINYGTDMSYSFKIVFKSNIVIPHSANISYYRYYANITNSPVTGNLTYISGSSINDYVNYNVPIINNSPNTYGNVYLNKLYVENDASFNSKLFVTNDVSFSNRMFVTNDVSFSNRLFVTKDASFSNRLFVTKDASFGGNINLNSLCRFPNNTNSKKLVLWDGSPNDNITSATNFFGFGISGGILRYQVDATSSSHAFYFGSDITNYVTSIAFDGVSSPSYNATSDYRIKANIIPLSDTSFSVDLLKPVTYMNKSLGKPDIGFIAHEVQEEIPFLVTGEKDGTHYQTLNYIGLIGLLTKEIQDLKKEVKEIRKELASYTK
jgi:hypothetical protein